MAACSKSYRSSTTMNNNNKIPHAVCVPYPAQGHINPMLKLAKLLHTKSNFHITFVNTHCNHIRLLKSRALNSVHPVPGFTFTSIPDGLSAGDTDAPDATQDIPSLCESTSKYCLVPFHELVCKINSDADVPDVSCIVSDGSMSFTLEVAREFGVPHVLFWTPSACGVLCYANLHVLVQRGLTPLKDETYLANGYLETAIDMTILNLEGKVMKIKDLPSFIRTTDPKDIMLNYVQKEISQVPRTSALILNTFDALENQVLSSLSNMFPPTPVLPIGPLHLLLDQVEGHELVRHFASNLWEEHHECIEWLDSRESSSVLYVNFGSITVITPNQLVEFAWGLANSKKPFLWSIRSDLVNVKNDQESILPQEFIEEIKGRGMLTGWCPQEMVLSHKAVYMFLSHMGWNSTLESVCQGVPMLCWPFFAEQQTNAWFACNVWGVGMEVGGDVKRGEVEKLVRELIDGEKGKEMKEMAMEFKVKAREAISPGGSSYENFKKLLKILQTK